MSKLSFRFYKDYQVRAIWDEDNSKWWFSVVDIVAAVTESPNPRKYWSVLKTRLKKAGNELTTRCSQLKMVSADGKKYATDCFAQEDITALVRNLPSKRTADFLDWFTYSDNSIDGQSRKKAYSLFESGILESMKPGTVKCLQQIHAYLFGGLYDFAGQIRMKTIWKDGTLFCRAEYLLQNLKRIEAMPENNFDEIVNKYVEMNIAHPFREGNGRTTRIWLDLILKKQLKLCIDWSKIEKKYYMDKMYEAAKMQMNKYKFEECHKIETDILKQLSMLKFEK